MLLSDHVLVASGPLEHGGARGSRLSSPARRRIEGGCDDTIEPVDHRDPDVIDTNSSSMYLGVPQSL